MPTRFKILIVDDEPEYRDVLASILASEGYTVEKAASGEEALRKFMSLPFDLVLTDLIMDGMNGVELLERLKAEDEETEVIVITGFGTVENAVEAMKKGAFSYFIKGHSPDELLLEIKKALDLARLRQENAWLRSGTGPDRYFLETRSKSYAEVLKVAKKAAAGNSNVLLVGESGAGKEVVAEYIHHASRRGRNHFFPINCHALPEGLLEDELFGHEKGAFTGADRLRKGKFEAAHGGTLLLDEIGEIPRSFQAKLLRVLETKQIQRIGGNRNIPVDFRLIAATNNNLAREISAGRFREDLFYRLCVIHINIPPLRERREDIEKLVEFFLDRFEWEMKKKTAIKDDVVWTFLQKYDYPGNIRELRNIIEQLVVLSDNGSIDRLTLDRTHFPLRMEHRRRTSLDPENDVTNLKEFRKQIEKEHIKRILTLAGDNKTRASEMLGISLRQLFNKISEYGLK